MFFLQGFQIKQAAFGNCENQPSDMRYANGFLNAVKKSHLFFILLFVLFLPFGLGYAQSIQSTVQGAAQGTVQGTTQRDFLVVQNQKTSNDQAPIRLTNQNTSKLSKENDDQLRIGFTIALKGDLFDSNLSYYTSHVEIVTQTFMTLLRNLDTGEITGGAAQSWQLEDRNKRIRFILRNDLYWSNGTKLVAQDFVRGIHRMVKFSEANAANFSGVVGIDKFFETKDPKDLGIYAPNDQMLVIEYEKPYTGDFKAFTLPIMVAISKEDDSDHKEPLAQKDNKLCYGPYRFKSITKGKIVLEKNPFSPDFEKTHFDEVVYYGTEDLDIYQAYREGKVDVLQGPNGSEMRKLIDEYPSEVIHNLYPRIYFVVRNLELPEAINDTVLEAMSIAVDRATLSDEFHKATTSPQFGIAPKGVGFYPGLDGLPAQIGTFEKRLRLARSHMASQGYSEENPLEIRFVYAKNVPGYKKIVEFLKKYWKKIHIKMNITTVEDYHSSLSAFASNEYDFILISTISDDKHPYQYLYSYGRHLTWAKKKPPEEFIKLLAAARENAAYQNYNDYALAVDRFLVEKYFIFPLINNRPVFLVKKDIRGLKEARRYTRPDLRVLDLYRGAVRKAAEK